MTADGGEEGCAVAQVSRPAVRGADVYFLGFECTLHTASFVLHHAVPESSVNYAAICSSKWPNKASISATTVAHVDQKKYRIFHSKNNFKPFVLKMSRSETHRRISSLTSERGRRGRGGSFPQVT